MVRQSSILGVILAGLLAVAVGCSPQQPFYFHEDGDLSHYIGKATEIEFPDVETLSLDEVTGAMEPLTLENPAPSEVWELGLEDAVRTTLTNSKVIRDLSRVQFTRNGPMGSPESLLSAPDVAASIYDPARTETNPRFGVEAAIAAFDPRFSASSFWEKTDIPQNITGFFAAIRPQFFQQELGTFQAQLAKMTATGGTWSLTHSANYESNNSPVDRFGEPIKLFASEWHANLEAQFRHPLFQGNGVQFNRIAGPGSIPGFNNGVMIARVNTDISLVDFEGQVRNLVNDVERAYWGLFLAYRRLDAYTKARDRAQEAWRKEREAYDAGGYKDRYGRWKGKRENVALTKHQYVWFKGLVEQALSDLYKTENNLRYIMGLTATDNRLIRPADGPTKAQVQFDWHETHAEALARSLELRRQKWRIRQRELELIAAKNWLLPRFDAVGRYRWRGFGDDLIDSNRNSDPFHSAYQSLTGGDFQDWQLGLELSLPLGFRKEMAGVKHAEFNLARERAVLQDQELELSHRLSEAIRDLWKSHSQLQTGLDRYIAAEEELGVWKAIEDAGQTVEEDRRVAAQQRAAEAELDYYQALVDYNLAITQIHFRKGSLLEYNNVYLAEGPWPAKAYFDALRRARARDASLYFDYGFTRPKVLSRGAYQQHAGQPPTVEIDSGVPPEGIPMPSLELEQPTPGSLEPLPESASFFRGAAPEMPEPQRGGAPSSAPNGSRLAGSTPATGSTRPRLSAQPVSGSEADFAQDEGRTARLADLRTSRQERFARHESVARPSLAEADGNASGWRGVQR